MVDQSLLRRITVRPDVFGGKPIIRDMRISVELILSLLEQGESWEAILGDYPDLEADDIRACLGSELRHRRASAGRFMCDACAPID